ncbi:MAG: glycosyltransferase family 4 protein [Patescibacteria group bacterium]
MKILFVLDSIHIGGPLSYTSGLVNFLNKKGFECIVMGGRGDTFKFAEEYLQKANIISYPIIKKSSFITKVNIIWQTFLNFSRVIKKQKPDVIHLSSTLSALGVLLSPLSWPYPKVSSFHGGWDLETDSVIKILGYYDRLSLAGRIKHKLKLHLLWILQRYCLQSVDKIIVLSQYAKKMVLEHFKVTKAKVELLYGGVDPAIYFPSRSKKQAKKALFIDPKCKLLSIVARPDPRKGFHLALKAVSKLNKKNPKFKLIIGVPNLNSFYLSELAKLYKSLGYTQSISFQLTLSIEDKVKLLQATDIFLMCSIRLETFGLTTLEAFSCGAIVIGTPTGATPEILKPISKFNLMTKGISVKSLVHKIEEVALLSPEKTREIQRKGREYSKREFSWERSLESLPTIYLKVVKK